MSKAAAIALAPRDPWRVYLIILQGLSIFGVWLAFQRAILFFISLGFFHSLANTGSSWIAGGYMTALVVVDMWALVDVIRRRPMTYHPIRLSVAMTLALWVFALVSSGGAWLNIIFYSIVAVFSWSKITAVQRMIFMTSVRLPKKTVPKKKPRSKK